MPTLHVVIPFYNEGPTAERCLRRLFGVRLPSPWSLGVVLVDDHSRQEDRRTVEEVIERLAADGHRIEGLRHEVNRGKGAAVRSGFDAVLAADPPADDLVVIQDADLEYDPGDLPLLMEPVLDARCEAVIGSRFGDHGPVAGLTRKIHAWGNGALTRLSNAMTGYRLSDMECCYKLTTVGMLRRLRPHLTESRYGVEPQMVAVLSALRARVIEVPVSYDPRTFAEGKKIGWRDGVRAVYVIVRERWRLAGERGSSAAAAEREPRNGLGALLPRRKLVMQLTGFVVGIALLVWIIANAVKEGHWGRVAAAPPLLVAALLGCTLASTVLNGLIFWITIRPLRPIRLMDLQRLNVVANMLNYAPVRLGAIARVVYHVRVDGLGLLQVGAWFGLIGYILVLGIASCVLATIVHDRVDWIWACLVAGQLALGGMAVRTFAGHPLLARYGQGVDKIAADRLAVWGAVGLRVVDLAAYAGRMGVAAMILQIDLSATQVVMLAVVALAASLIPFGRVGFREFCVAAAGQQLSTLAGGVEANMNQLALIESAGEALVLIPLGIVFLLWFKRRFAQAAKAPMPHPNH